MYYQCLESHTLDGYPINIFLCLTTFYKDDSKNEKVMKFWFELNVTVKIESTYFLPVNAKRGIRKKYWKQVLNSWLEKKWGIKKQSFHDTAINSRSWVILDGSENMKEKEKPESLWVFLEDIHQIWLLKKAVLKLLSLIRSMPCLKNKAGDAGADKK